MNSLAILVKSLKHHRRTNLAVTLCVFAGSAALTGALLVGDSMRGSLRDLALKRLGPVDHALMAPRFFRERLADDIAAGERFAAAFAGACPAITARAAIHHADTKARAGRINVFGVDNRFWELDGSPAPDGMDGNERSVVLNRALAEELGAKVGDDVLLRLPNRSLVPTETPLGRPDETALSIRLTVSRILPMEGRGRFGLKPDQYVPRNAFVPLRALQRAMERPGRINTILVAGRSQATGFDTVRQGLVLAELTASSVRLEDYDLRIRVADAAGYAALETDRLLIEPPVETAVLQAAASLQAPVLPILTYLANTIAVVREGEPAGPVAGIPYSTIAALNPEDANFLPAAVLASGGVLDELAADEILLNQWAASDLGAKVGDRIRVAYYGSKVFGGLDTEEAVFTLRGILPMTGWAVDRGLMPTYEGISDAKNLSDWDPPPSFEIDFDRIREKDEQYWDAYRGTPKAFVPLRTGQRLWTEQGSRFGKLTSIYIGVTPGLEPRTLADAIERSLLRDLDPARMGLAFEPVKSRALLAGAGSTDFRQLFGAFSFFLIAAAALLVALIFRLGVERRAGEIGILLAAGYPARQVRRIFLLEGALLADLGSALGLLGAVGYAWLMLAGLRSASWWAGAVNAPFLQLHVSWLSLILGYVGSFAIALLSIAWSIRGLTKMSPRALMAGAVQSGRPDASKRRGRIGSITLAASVLVGGGGLCATLVSDAVPAAVLFFVVGGALLTAGLAALSIWMGRERHGLIRMGGLGAALRLGVRNVVRSRGRSLATTALIASSSFVIVAVGASRHDEDERALTKAGGTGGFALMCEAIVPLQYDLNAAEGREALNVTPKTAALLEKSTVTAMRVRPGDDTSCLNLYQVLRPKILGAPSAMIERGGFSFGRTLAETKSEKENPWRLLDRTFDDGAVPAFGDANTLTYLLKLGLGDDFVMTDERGRPLKLRIVGMLSGSILQGELVVAEERFVEHFPSVSGYGFLLIESPSDASGPLARALEADLSDYGLDAESTVVRLNEYRAVENTYMATFQTLGGLGLILGTFGLAAVMLRNVLERRGELALLRALGHRQSGLGWMVLAENAALLCAGLLIGSVSALLAVAPHALSKPGEIPWVSLAAILATVFLVGMLASVTALRSTLKTPLLPALRAE